MPAIQKCEDVFIEQLAKSKGQPVDIRGWVSSQECC